MFEVSCVKYEYDYNVEIYLSKEGQISSDFGHV